MVIKMQRYFIKNINIEAKTAFLDGNDFHHIAHVMRGRVGDRLVVCNHQEQCFISEITTIDAKHVEVQLLESLSSTELPVEVTLAQSLIRRERFEYVLQKATELGVHSIIPVQSKYSIVKIDKKVDKKVERWNTITKEASEQAHRSYCAGVLNPIHSFRELDLFKYDQVLVAYELETESTTLHSILSTQVNNIMIVIGPEGGLHPDEIAYFSGFDNVHFVGLGKRILRSETASSYLLSAISYEYEMGNLR